jgi:hypothetical protein
MNYVLNKIKFNRPVTRFFAKESKKKYNFQKNVVRYHSNSPGKMPNNNPFPTWKILTFLCGLGLYHQYVRRDKIN